MGELIDGRGPWQAEPKGVNRRKAEGRTPSLRRRHDQKQIDRLGLLQMQIVRRLLHAAGYPGRACPACNAGSQ
jgi:hypothetical protein